MPKPKEPEMVTLDISAKQYGLVAKADAAVKRASEDKDLVIQTIVAGLDVPPGAVVEHVQKDPPSIVVRLPESKE